MYNSLSASKPLWKIVYRKRKGALINKRFPFTVRFTQRSGLKCALMRCANLAGAVSVLFNVNAKAINE